MSVLLARFRFALQPSHPVLDDLLELPSEARS